MFNSGATAPHRGGKHVRTGCSSLRDVSSRVDGTGTHLFSGDSRVVAVRICRFLFTGGDPPVMKMPLSSSGAGEAPLA